ncbi:hypothetical protein QAD02_006458 [Eretmocerus hayati]|uniref:Uncharacterized protein n=1 Tax=Eretmocerus hayati TaxID=131215 RepID=A0ACC2N230_9HYME|nr:hypothetical protein QAD02_006458 [Eretmocerus hayati]
MHPYGKMTKKSNINGDMWGNRNLTSTQVGLAHQEEAVIKSKHGDRAPTKREVYPNDPNKAENLYPNGYGELTLKGQLRASELGRQLRARYDSYIGKNFTEDDVDVVSTLSHRAQKTLELVLADFLPEWYRFIKRNVLNDTENFMTDRHCPRYDSEYKRVSKIPGVQSEIDKFKRVMKYLSAYTGKSFSHPSTMLSLYHLLDAELSSNQKLPKWTKKVFPNGLLLHGATLAYRIKSYSTLQRKLNGGKLLLNIIRKIDAVKQNVSQVSPKINLYSGHETNIAALLATLGVYEPHVPQYTSAVIIELHEQEFQYYVKVVYYLGRPSIFKNLKIPGCSEFCPYVEFLRLLKDVIPEDESICHQ